MSLKIRTFAICTISLLLLSNCYTSSTAIGEASDNKRSNDNINNDTEQIGGIKNSSNVENKVNKVSELRKSLVIPE